MQVINNNQNISESNSNSVDQYIETNNINKDYSPISKVTEKVFMNNSFEINQPIESNYPPNQIND